MKSSLLFSWAISIPLVFLFSSFFISCNGKIDFDAALKYTLIQDGSVNFELDDESSMFLNHLQYYDFNKETVLTFLNEYTNAIYIYDTKSKKLLNKHQFDIDGPNGVGKIQGYSFLAMDTVLLIDTYRYKAVLYALLEDVKPNKIKEYNFTSGQINPKNGFSYEPNSSLPWMRTFSPSISSVSQTFWISAFPESSTKPTSSETINFFIINSQDSIEKRSNFPSEMNGNFWEDGNLPRMTASLDSSGVVFSFKYSNTIGILREGSLKASFVNPNGKFKENKKQFSQEPTSHESSERYIQSYTVYNLLADPYRNVYYRIIEEPNFKEIEINGERRDSKKPIIQIFDTNLSLVGEVSLPNYEYLYNMCFVSEIGLMISQPKVDYVKMKMDENILRFVVFKLKPI